MKNKTLIYIIILLIIIIVLGIAGVIYFAKENKFSNGGSGESAEESGLFGKETAQGEQEEEEENVLFNDNFSINIPEGWRETAASVGVSAMVVNVNEEITNPDAKKINFKSYFSVVYDSLQGKSKEEYIDYLKNSLEQAVPGIIFIQEKTTTMNERNAYALEAELKQQGVDFNVLIILVYGDGEDIWVMSFNTLRDKWTDYKDLFYQTADTFQIKQ